MCSLSALKDSPWCNEAAEVDCDWRWSARGDDLVPAYRAGSEEIPEALLEQGRGSWICVPNQPPFAAQVFTPPSN